MVVYCDPGYDDVPGGVGVDRDFYQLLVHRGNFPPVSCEHDHEEAVCRTRHGRQGELRLNCNQEVLLVRYLFERDNADYQISENRPVDKML